MWQISIPDKCQNIVIFTSTYRLVLQVIYHKIPQFDISMLEQMVFHKSPIEF